MLIQHGLGSYYSLKQCMPVSQNAFIIFFCPDFWRFFLIYILTLFATAIRLSYYNLFPEHCPVEEQPKYLLNYRILVSPLFQDVCISPFAQESSYSYVFQQNLKQQLISLRKLPDSDSRRCCISKEVVDPSQVLSF